MEATRLRGACTIVSPNYLPFARTLAHSYCAHHPGEEFFVLVVGRNIPRSEFKEEPYTVVLLEDIGLSNIPSLAMKYGILELNTNVKPRFMLYLLVQRSLAALVYLDPDIFVYSRLEPVFELLREHSAILTPHLTSPMAEEDCGFEQEVLYNGIYNLGFLAVKRDEEILRMLEWWDRRCIGNGFNEGRTGLFVDQKWMNLAPSLFEGFSQCKHLGCNMAFWNLHERKLSQRDGQYLVNAETKLCFFHFSGVSIDRPDILSKNTNRHSLSSRPDLQEMFRGYKQAVAQNRISKLDGIAYGYDHFDDGTAVTLLARRIYAAHESSFNFEDPFQMNSKFYRFAKKLGLTAGKIQPPKMVWDDVTKEDRRIKTVHALLRTALKLLGPNRYELLMKYLSFISILRHQAVFIKD